MNDAMEIVNLVEDLKRTQWEMSDIIEDQRARLKLAADYILKQIDGHVDNDRAALIRLWREIAGPDAVPIQEDRLEDN